MTRKRFPSARFLARKRPWEPSTAADATSGAFFSTEYARRHGLPARASLQRGVGKLVEDELVSHLGPGRYRIAEPFLDEWVRRYAS